MKTIPHLLLYGFCLFACSVLPGQTALSPGSTSQSTPVELRQKHPANNLEFVVYGDTRFTASPDPSVSNGPVRRELVAAIKSVHPAFICVGGDLVFAGADPADWRDWDSETAVWRSVHIPVYPAIGNHEVKGDEASGLANYFRRFPELKGNRFYSVIAGNVLIFVLDSNLDVSAGPQWEWLSQKLDNIPANADFVLFLLHHPPITTAIDSKDPENKPEIRLPEETLARRLEERQKTTRSRFVVVAGHVHNYERHHRNGVTYLVSGGGGAHAKVIERDMLEPYPDDRINYHYLQFKVDGRELLMTMHRLEFINNKPVWTTPDSVSILAPASLPPLHSRALQR